MIQLAPGFYQLTFPPGINMYLTEDPDGLTLIDASLASAANHVLGAIRKLGRTPADLKRIVITHAHPDHVGALPALKKNSGAQVIASEIERPVIEGKLAVPRNPNSWLKLPNTRLPPCPVDWCIEDEDEIPAWGGLVAVFTPGHAPGHMAYWQPERKLLICGDVIFNLLGLSLPPGIVTVDMAENRRSAARLAEIEPEIACFGHGSALTRDTAAALRRFARKVAPE